MNKISLYPKSTLRISTHNRRAVSDVVAVLILIVIAIIGAVAVGLILSTTSHSVGNQAASNGNGSSAQSVLYIGGSTTVFPITEAAKPSFESTYHVNIVDAQGGSDAGMQGVLSGALDIGAASSASAVNNLENAVINNNLQSSVTVNYVLIGGSVVVPIENGPSTTPAGFLQSTDTVPNVCLGISQDALSAAFQLGSFGIMSGACATGAPNYATLLAGTGTGGEDQATSNTICTASSVTSATLSDGFSQTYGLCSALAPIPATITAVSRADNSGTEDQMASFLAQHPAKQSSGGNWAGVTEQGNPGVLNYVNTHSNTIGFVDLGFAEGAASGAICPAGHTAATTCGVSMPQAFTSAAGAYPASLSTNPVAMVSGQGYVAKGASTSEAESLSKAALKSAGSVNPLTLSGQSASYPDTHAPGTGLARTFYYVTNGTPTPTEQEWISFITNYNQEFAFTNNGYYSQYDFTQA